MDKGEIAELILSLAMEPARAVSVVGDLLEAGCSRNPAWFWSNVLQTFASAVWHDAKTQPLLVIRLAAYGAMAQVGLTVIASVVCAIFVAVLFKANPNLATTRTTLYLFFPVVILLPYFCAGRWMALRSSGKCIAACAVMVVGMPVISNGIKALLVWGIPLLSTNLAIPKFEFAWWCWYQIIEMAACVAGAALVRRRPKAA